MYGQSADKHKGKRFAQVSQLAGRQLANGSKSSSTGGTATSNIRDTIIVSNDNVRDGRHGRRLKALSEEESERAKELELEVNKESTGTRARRLLLIIGRLLAALLSELLGRVLHLAPHLRSFSPWTLNWPTHGQQQQQQQRRIRSKRSQAGGGSISGLTKMETSKRVDGLSEPDRATGSVCHDEFDEYKRSGLANGLDVQVTIGTSAHANGQAAAAATTISAQHEVPDAGGREAAVADQVERRQQVASSLSELILNEALAKVRELGESLQSDGQSGCELMSDQSESSNMSTSIETPAATAPRLGGEEGDDEEIIKRKLVLTELQQRHKHLNQTLDEDEKQREDNEDVVDEKEEAVENIDAMNKDNCESSMVEMLIDKSEKCEGHQAECESLAEEHALAELQVVDAQPEATTGEDEIDTSQVRSSPGATNVDHLVPQDSISPRAESIILNGDGGEQPDSADELASSDPGEQSESLGVSELDEGGASDSDEFCGEPASTSTLRRLKLDAFEDVLVCERNRDSMNAARRLFDSLDRAGDDQQVAVAKQQHKQSSGRVYSKWAGSLSSANLATTTDGSDTGGSMTASSCASERSASPSSPQRATSAAGTDLRGQQRADDIYGIKLVKRAGSSASSGCNTNFRRTLVCSVSPTSQLDGSSSDMSVLASDPHLLYPIDGEEIRQCRAAFRENKRLIENQQKRASSERRCQSSCSASEGRPTMLAGRNFGGANRRAHCNDQQQQQQQQVSCSRCSKRVYPVDKLELDFTKTTTVVHRNCFKCQVCSSLLRLDSYFSIDAKLYCQAHVKFVTPAR